MLGQKPAGKFVERLGEELMGVGIHLAQAGGMLLRSTLPSPRVCCHSY